MMDGQLMVAGRADGGVDEGVDEAEGFAQLTVAGRDEAIAMPPDSHN